MRTAVAEKQMEMVELVRLSHELRQPYARIWRLAVSGRVRSQRRGRFWYARREDVVEVLRLNGGE